MSLLPSLDHAPADDLEGQDLDFKRWPEGRTDASRQVVEAAIGMANGGGGTVVFGVADRIRGRSGALPGIPADVDVHLLKKAVYDSTDPKITPVFEEIAIPEGTGRLLAMQIHPHMPPHTDTGGRGWIRVGKDCQPLTGSVRLQMAEISGESDFTAKTVPGDPAAHLSAAAMERLRHVARGEQAPAAELPDGELLGSLRLVRDGKLAVAGLLLAGRDESIREHVPGAGWTWLHMRTETAYENREDGTTALPLAVARLEDLVRPHNPLTTLEQGFFHLEYRRWPEIALREALMNAFCHRDYRRAGPVILRMDADGLCLESLGGFVPGVTPANILRHPPETWNTALVSALVTLRLVNRANLGVIRMYKALLLEGKPPPTLEDTGDSVRVLFKNQDLSSAFRRFAAEEEKQGRMLDMDALLTLHHLWRYPETDTAALANHCQRDAASFGDTLAGMDKLHISYAAAGAETYIGRSIPGWRISRKARPGPNPYGALAGRPLKGGF